MELPLPHKKILLFVNLKEDGKGEITGDYPNTKNGKKVIKKLDKMSLEYEIKIYYKTSPCGYALKK